MSDLYLLDEPMLEFRYGQTLGAPHDGLALMGPFDADLPSRPGNLSYGLIGTEEGIEKFRAFARLVAGPIIPSSDLDHRLWPPFPGFDVAFACDWPPDPAWEAVIDKEGLLRDTLIGESHERSYAVVGRFLHHLERASQRDERLSPVFCILPEEVYLRCRPKSQVSVRDRASAPLTSETRTLVSAGQQDLFDRKAVDRYRFSVDFRRQLKARSMHLGMPLQLLRETTLRPSDSNANPNARGLTPLADRAWNLGVTAYYKAGGKPWRLATARPGVCYVGLAFRQTTDDEKRDTAVCAAQMFLESGDGIVFKGETGPWYSEDTNDFHLSPDVARELLAGVIKTYESLGGLPLTEVFLHSRSDINAEEFTGYRAAVPSETDLVGIRVRAEGTSGFRLLRPGTRPVIRGTFWRTGSRSGLLWGSGFVPRTRTYAGSDIPIPLRIDIQYGSADIVQVARDILSLTKLNYNSCSFGDGEPVTIGFSDKVGEILVGNPGASERQPQFRYYI